MTSWLSRWASMIASSISGSGISSAEPLDHHDRLVGAGDDEVEVALLHLGGGREGDDTWPSTRPSRMAPIGPMNGTSWQRISEAEAPMIERTSGH